MYLPIGIYIKFFGNIITFNFLNNPVQEIANYPMGSKILCEVAAGLCVMLSAAIWPCPAVITWCGGLWMVGGGGEGSREKERESGPLR